MTQHRRIRVSPDISFPARRFAEAHSMVIGVSGRGKSGLVRVMCETAYGANIPLSIIDPIGLYWGLRSSFNGKYSSGIKIPVICGDHADLVVSHEAGYGLAEAVCEMGISVVTDLSLMTAKEGRRFVEGFADGLFRYNTSTRHVVVEETPEFLPMRISPVYERVSESMERLVLRGRNRALGTTLVSQRIANLNGNARSQCDTMFIFGLVSPQDREAMADWVSAKAGKNLLKELEEGLASLGKREAWVWSPEMFDLFEPFYVRTFRTLHPDRTHLSRRDITRMKPAMTDVSEITSELKGRLGAAVEKRSAEQENEALLEKIAELEAKIREKSVYIGANPEVLEKAASEAVAKAETEFRRRRDIAGIRLREIAESLGAVARSEPLAGKAVKSLLDLVDGW